MDFTGAIESAPIGALLGMVGIPLAMAGVAIFAGLHARTQARAIATTPYVPIGEAENGFALFAGRVEAVVGDSLRAPLTHAPCCWYAMRVDEYVPSKSSAPANWRQIHSSVSEAPFLLRDETGVCALYPDGADVTPTDRSVWYGATREPADRDPPRVPPTESPEGMLRVAGGPNSKFRYREERIYAGDPLFATGWFDDGKPRVDADDDEEEEREDVDPRVAAVTHASIRRGGAKGQRFVVSTTTPDVHARLYAQGGKAALGFALLPLAVVAYVLAARFT
jgi:hypothetical protein